jgi:hypothetical protein
MKTIRKNKDFDAVAFMRQSREKISRDIGDLTTEQILEYFKKRTPVERIMSGV